MNPALRIHIDANAIQRRYCRKVAERVINQLRDDGILVYRMGTEVTLRASVGVDLDEIIDRIRMLKPWLLQLLDEESAVRN